MGRSRYDKEETGQAVALVFVCEKGEKNETRAIMRKGEGTTNRGRRETSTGKRNTKVEAQKWKDWVEENIWGGCKKAGTFATSGGQQDEKSCSILIDVF